MLMLAQIQWGVWNTMLRSLEIWKIQSRGTTETGSIICWFNFCSSCCARARPLSSSGARCGLTVPGWPAPRHCRFRDGRRHRERCERRRMWRLSTRTMSGPRSVYGWPTAQPHVFGRKQMGQDRQNPTLQIIYNWAGRFQRCVIDL